MEKPVHCRSERTYFCFGCGAKYPENEQLGVDVVVPNFDYLEENKHRVAGVFLSHGHADAIGALPYLLEKVKVPVFGSHLTIELAKLLVKGNNATKKFNDFHVINADTEIDFGDSVVSFFQTTHSIPESLGIVVKTDEGNIVYTGDFKFDRQISFIVRILGDWLKSVTKVCWPSCQTQLTQIAMFK